MDGIFNKNPKTCRNICGIGQHVTGCGVLVRRDGVAPSVYLTSLIYSQVPSLLGIPTHEVTQRVTRYFEVSIFILLANLDGGSVRKAICFTLPAALKSAIGITNICWSLSKQNK